MTYLHISWFLPRFQIVELCIICHYTTYMSSFIDYNLQSNALDVLLKMIYSVYGLFCRNIKVWLCKWLAYLLHHTDFNDRGGGAVN